MKANSSNLDKLESTYKFSLPGNQEDLALKARESVIRFNQGGDIEKLALDLRTVEDSLLIMGAKHDYLDLLHITNESINNYLIFRSKAMEELDVTQGNIESVLAKIQEELNKPTNSQNEMIKRFILSIVIVTFFLAILKYSANLYRSHHAEMLKAEQHDFMIRKFYVTLKSSEGNSEERKLVLAAFLSDVKYLNDQGNRNPKGKSQGIESEILKDIITAISKKI
jgi:hypothetical protein